MSDKVYQNSFFREHIRRIRSAINPANQVNTIADWMTTNTFIEGKLMSFKDHEYQEYLANLDKPVIYIQKSSQVGLSQFINHWLLGYLMMNPGHGAIYVLHTARFSNSFGATRTGPIIESSPVLKAALDPNVGSASVRRFRNGSILYMVGASKGSQAISMPASVVIGDEIDAYEDDTILSVFASRLTHALKPLERYFSTPSFNDFGVNAGFNNSKQHVQLQKCFRCNHEFEPSYWDDVKLPKFKGHLREINYFTREKLDKYDLSTAYLSCPKCNKSVDQDIKYRRFVVKNPNSQSRITGVHITPFCSPLYMPPSKLILTSTKYKNRGDFYNQALGETYSDASSGLTEDEVQEMFVQDVNYPINPPVTVLGCDLGGSCAIIIGYPSPNGHIRIVDVDWIPLHQMKQEFVKKLASYKVISSVCDGLPYTDLVRVLQDQSHTLFAALTTTTKSMDLYTLKSVEEDENRATFGVRQLKYKRDSLLDFVMMMVRNKQISFAPTTWKFRNRIKEELCDMKRVSVTDQNDEKKFVWKKTQRGNDHIHHALAFLILANFIKGVSSPAPSLPTLITKFKVAPNILY